jgi:hypothetical protein
MTLGQSGARAGRTADRAKAESRDACPAPDGTISLQIDSLAWQELAREAELHSLAPEELASFAILYYLADVDSGRIARRISSYRGDG